MRKTILITLVALLALATTAAAKTPRYYIPKPHHACRASYKREVVKIRERKHGKLVRRHHKIVMVKETRCVYVKPKATKPSAPTSAPAPTIHYLARVDPSFVQSPSDPLAVTYSYTADATSQTDGIVTDLATVGDLPGGVLNFFDGGELACSMNVGGSTTGGDCSIDYPHTGTFSVTTQYLPSGTAGVTETESETILPFTTSSALTSQTSGSTTTYADSVTDEHGNAVQPDEVEWVISDVTTGQVVGTFPGQGAQELFKLVTDYDWNTHQPDGQAIGIFNPGASAMTAESAEINPADAFTVQAVDQPASTHPIWTGSETPAVALVLSS